MREGSPRVLFPKEEMSWRGMVQRCTNPRAANYRNYGGRGIKVCDSWRLSFWQFLEDMGPRPDGYSIDRIDTDGNYEPSNCRWASWEVQSRNRTNNNRIELNDKKSIVTDWAVELGIKPNTLLYRKRRGWSAEEALGLVERTKPCVRKIKPEQEPLIYSLYLQGKTQTQLGREYNIDSSTISRICSRQAHKTQENKKNAGK